MADAPSGQAPLKALVEAAQRLGLVRKAAQDAAQAVYTPPPATPPTIPPAQS